MKTFIRIIILCIVGIMVVVLVSDSKDVHLQPEPNEEAETVDEEVDDFLEEEIVVPPEEEPEEDVVPELPPGWQEDGSVILGGDGIPNN